MVASFFSYYLNTGFSFSTENPGQCDNPYHGGSMSLADFEEGLVKCILGFNFWLEVCTIKFYLDFYYYLALDLNNIYQAIILNFIPFPSFHDIPALQLSSV